MHPCPEFMLNPRLHSLKQEDGNHEGMKEFEYGR